MNARDVRALGAVLTRDVFADSARSAFLNRRKMTPDARRALVGRWSALQSSLIADRLISPDASLPRSLETPLSERTEAAVAALVNELAAFYPDSYGQGSLRDRCLGACGRAIASAVSSAILFFTSPDGPFVGDAGRLLFLVACWSLVTSVQLWRTYVLVEQVSRRRRSPSVGAVAGLADERAARRPREMKDRSE